MTEQGSYRTEADFTPSLDERVMDTLAYYECRRVNPKADDPRMGYHAFTEDQREHLREAHREAAEALMPFIGAVRVEEREKAAQAPTDDERAEWRDEAIRRYPHAEVAKYMRQALQNAFIEGARFAARIRNN